MGNEDFRRELNNAIDNISGSPSHGLRDRVRSRLIETPSRGGPFWIAGVAAVTIAVLIVGILFVINPNRNNPIIGGVGQVSPSPSASPTATTSPSPSPSASPAASPTPAFTCANMAPITTQQPANPIAYVSALRTGAHAGYDRVTVEFSNGQPASIEVRPQAGTKFVLGESGQTVTLPGKNGILVVIHGADAHTSYSGPRDLKTNYPRLVETRITEDFEGVVQLGLGINGPACYRFSVLTNPTRLVIDVQAP